MIRELLKLAPILILVGFLSSCGKDTHQLQQKTIKVATTKDYEGIYLFREGGELKLIVNSNGKLDLTVLEEIKLEDKANGVISTLPLKKFTDLEVDKNGKIVVTFNKKIRLSDNLYNTLGETILGIKIIKVELTKNLHNNLLEVVGLIHNSKEELDKKIALTKIEDISLDQ